jgi:hypothetical protein
MRFLRPPRGLEDCGVDRVQQRRDLVVRGIPARRSDAAARTVESPRRAQSLQPEQVFLQRVDEPPEAANARRLPHEGLPRRDAEGVHALP